MAEKVNFGLVRVENIVGKGENAGYQHFLLFPQCYQKASFSMSIKLELCGKSLRGRGKWDECGKLIFN